ENIFLSLATNKADETNITSSGRHLVFLNTMSHRKLVELSHTPTCFISCQEKVKE
ncbi:13898_t:CDS:2, partial [Dentiscutata erythropus]